MAERLVREVEVAGREGLAWLLGVASLRREALSRVAQVLAWVSAVETQRGEARDAAAAAEARCDELELDLSVLRAELAVAKAGR